MLNVSDSIADKLFWLLKHFDKSELEIISFDVELEAEIKKGINSPVSPLSHKEVFQGFRTQYAQG
ncbi:MAG: hypothetical protein WA080_01545 [Sulfuricurvum sp.]